jgi:HSP20 family molecular chaperone IbpA
MTRKTLFEYALNQVYRSVRLAIAKRWSPPVKIQKRDDEVVLSFDVASIPRQQFGVTVSRGRLVLTGCRGSLRMRGLNESPGRFRRAVALPSDADGEQVKTELRQGVLEVHVSRRPPCTPLA